jgi:diguanylate cyclase (GGDEF)-like protein
VARAGDLIGRYGGEEFLVVLGNTDAAGARGIAERLWSLVAAANLPHPASPTGPVVTVSIGAATAAPGPGSRYEGLIEAADAALYHAKRAGRNRVADGIELRLTASAADVPA